MTTLLGWRGSGHSERLWLGAGSYLALAQQHAGRVYTAARQVAKCTGFDYTPDMKSWRGRNVHYSERYPRVYWPEHPQAAKGGMVRIHRVVASEMLGRYLESDEHVHHKDDNPLNWRRSNLEVKPRPLHSSHHARKQGGGRVNVTCAYCGEAFVVPASRAARSKTLCCSLGCANSYHGASKWPDDVELRRLVWERPVTRLAKSLGVSSSAVKKRCRLRGISTPPRGYWKKRQ